MPTGTQASERATPAQPYRYAALWPLSTPRQAPAEKQAAHHATTRPLLLLLRDSGSASLPTASSAITKHGSHKHPPNGCILSQLICGTPSPASRALEHANALLTIGLERPRQHAIIQVTFLVCRLDCTQVPAFILGHLYIHQACCLLQLSRLLSVSHAPCTLALDCTSQTLKPPQRPPIKTLYQCNGITTHAFACCGIVLLLRASSTCLQGSAVAPAKVARALLIFFSLPSRVCIKLAIK